MKKIGEELAKSVKTKTSTTNKKQNETQRYDFLLFYVIILPCPPLCHRIKTFTGTLGIFNSKEHLCLNDRGFQNADFHLDVGMDALIPMTNW